MNEVRVQAKPPKGTPTNGGGGESGGRIASIDLLRGLVMVLMALDHTRAIFHGSEASVRDVTEPALFLTRWITHFCAPTFVFLAGLSAWLYGDKVKSRTDLAWFLLTRGLFLIALELTLVHAAWELAAGLNVFALQVIWVIGVSMVALAALIFLPLWLIAAAALAMIAGHNLLDGIKAESWGDWAWLWNVLHQRGSVHPLPGMRLIVVYPAIPWVGVMAAGYALGPLYRLAPERRARLLMGLGGALIAAFLLLRVPNLYGDPAPWVAQARWWESLLAILGAEKYPPSLAYLLMTLGPALVLLGAFEGARGAAVRVVMVFGRVPFFYYLTHLAWIGVLSLLATLVSLALQGALPPEPGAFAKANRFTVNLAGVYLLWFFVVASLYPLCAWFAHLKATRSGWWWRYL